MVRGHPCVMRPKKARFFALLPLIAKETVGLLGSAPGGLPGGRCRAPLAISEVAVFDSTRGPSCRLPCRDLAPLGGGLTRADDGGRPLYDRSVPPELLHLLFDTLAYGVGFAILRAQRRQQDFLPSATRWTLVVAAVLGALVGAKVLHWLANPSQWASFVEQPLLLLGGKTLVGGLLGGWAAVEVAKRRLGVEQRTGDLYVLPLIVGIGIGRLGCFFAGLSDRTYGRVTTLPWGVDFGDGLARHPTQLYELVFVLLLVPVLFRRPPAEVGIRFRAFVLAYLAFRLGVDFLKPYDRLFGLQPIQWACLGVLLQQARELPKISAWLLDVPSSRLPPADLEALE